MDAYVFQAALLCEDCSANVKQRITATSTGVGGGKIECSGHWPQGPFTQGGGEADTPQHCDGCNAFLDNPLTVDGEAYVRDAVECGLDDNTVLETWREAYSYLFNA